MGPDWRGRLVRLVSRVLEIIYSCHSDFFLHTSQDHRTLPFQPPRLDWKHLVVDFSLAND